MRPAPRRTRGGKSGPFYETEMKREAQFDGRGRLRNASIIAADCGVRRETIWLALKLKRAPGRRLRAKLAAWGIELPADPKAYEYGQGRG